VFADDNVDGGILASPVLGRAGTTMEGLIIYNVSYEVSGSSSTSRLVALNKMDGSLAWEYDMEVSGWSPSSPVPVYTQDGQGYIVQCDRDGDIVLLRVDGESAVEAAKLNVEDNFEATPAVFDNMIVVGSRKSHFFFIKME
jgi:outer membrane protein assembly factor BamB